MPGEVVRYCTSADGVRIAYNIEGSGPALLWTPLIFESLAKESMTPTVGNFIARLRERFRVIRFDQRGTGLSSRDVTDLSPPATRADLEAVLAAARVARVHLMAHPGWAVHLLTYAAEHPAAISSVIVWNGQASMAEAMPEGVYDSMVAFVRANWALASRPLADFGGRQLGDEPLRLAQACHESASGANVAAILEANRHVDATPALGRVRCPVLVLVNQGMLPQGEEPARRLASLLPDARLADFDEREYVLHPSAIDRPFDVIIDFVAQHDPGRDPHPGAGRPHTSGVRVILFTDVVAHTEMMRRLGDQRGRDVLREHEQVTRKLLIAHGGAEVKTMGDGFMAWFNSMTSAVDCAIALQQAVTSRLAPLSIRVGLNAGEPIEEDGDLFGSAVIMASRIAAAAGPGEILMPELLRHLLAGKDYAYADRGESILKGFEDPVRLFEVQWKS
jgi:class 3 adenylate cyclase